jgi:Fe-Mn family superoxide dismutase
MNNYILPDLKYGYKDLEPYISEEQLKIHHLKHHQAYINNANAIMEKLDKSRKENSELDIKAVLKDLSFNIGGHVLHSYFWNNLEAPKENNTPGSKLLEAIKNEFSSFERFKSEFSKAALTVEGSGWAALSYCKKHDKLLVTQIEKHNVNLYPDFKIVLVLDVWEHAYYLDYKNDRAKFIDGFWDMVNWKEAERRMINI